MTARMRLVAIGASVLACVAAGAASALAGSASVRRTTAQNHHAARRDASALLGQVPLPNGATRSSQEPAGDGGVLAGPAFMIGVGNLVDDHSWWTVNEGLNQVFDYVQSNPPHGGTLDTTCGSAANTQPQWKCLGFSFSPRPGVLGVRELVVSIVALGDGSTGIRADTEVQWIVPRSPAEKVPAGTRIVHVVKVVPGQRPSVSRTVTSRSEVHKIVRLIDRLPTVQPANYHCPAQTSSVPVVSFTFQSSANGSVLARASVRSDVLNDDSICEAMTFRVDGRSEPALGRARGFLTAVGRLLGVTLTSR